MKPATTVTELDVGQVEEVLDRVEQEMGVETVRPLRLLLAWALSLLALLQEKSLSIGRLRRLVFGSSTERTRGVVPEDDKRESPTPREGQSSEPPAPDAPDNAAESSDAPDAANSRRRRPRKGHGRIPATEYTGCERVIITHEAFSPGDSCPHCQEKEERGTLAGRRPGADRRVHDRHSVDGRGAAEHRVVLHRSPSLRRESAARPRAAVGRPVANVADV